MKTNSSRLKQSIKAALQKIRLHYLAYKDIRRFSNHAAFSIFDNSYDQICARIMYNVHAIEKGLSRGSGMRLGFGRQAFSDLNDALVVYVRSGFPLDSFPFLQGRSIVHRYVEAHGQQAAEGDATLAVVDRSFRVHEGAFVAAGTKVIHRAEKERNASKGFYELAQGRSSVREFSGMAIDMAKVENALRNAAKTPSVCNRQGWRAYVVTHPEKMKELLRLQRGFKGYPTQPECVVVICVSNSSFLSPVERNEAFVDGGLFAMSVLYGLEAEGLAAVPLNAMMNSVDERDIRKLVEVDPALQIVMFIAVGDFKEETIVPVSDRKMLTDYVTYVG